MPRSVAQNRSQLVEQAGNGHAWAEALLRVYDANVKSGIETWCVIKFGKPGGRERFFEGTFPGETCEQIDRLIAQQLQPIYGARGRGFVLTVLAHDD